jgi:hypothetical protein
MLTELWSGILEVIGQVIIPVWNDLIGYIPLLLALGIIAIVGLVAWMWARHASGNRSRVPRPVPAGRKPEDMHLPGPSLWPFVAPVGLLFILFGLALGPFGSLVNVAILGVGLLIAIVGITGWYLEASREYVQVEAGGHGAGAEAVGGLPGWALKPPAGMHLPGPSAWPLLAPAGLLFLASGLVFGPAMFIGGLVMASIAAIGWLLDANKELQDVKEHGHASPADRDPENAWPHRLIPVYFVVGGASIALTLLPWLISLLPGDGG